MKVSLSSFLAEIQALPKPDLPALRTLRKRVSKQIQDAEPDEVLSLGLGLVEHRRHFLAYELILNHKPTLASLRTKEIEQLGAGIDTWDRVDCFACFISGVAWRNGQLSDSVIHRWAKSKDLWWRRAALVSTVPLNLKARGGTGDPERTLAVCVRLTQDREDMVVKALSWALRELSKRYPEKVRSFLNEHEVAARVRREVSAKLQTGLKNPPRPA